jgi:hypothetical protein
VSTVAVRPKLLRIALVLNEPFSAITGEPPEIWSNEDLKRLAADSAWAASRAVVRTRTWTNLDMPPRAKSRGRNRILPVGPDPSWRAGAGEFRIVGSAHTGRVTVFSDVGKSMTGAGYNEGDIVYIATTREVRAAGTKSSSARSMTCRS